MELDHIHETITDICRLNEVISVISKQSIIGFDLETEGLNWWDKHKIVGIGLGYYNKVNTIYTYYLPFLHRKYLNSNHVAQENLFYKDIELLSDIMGNDSIYKVGANIKFDAHFIEATGYRLQPLHDVQVMARLLRTDYLKVGLDKLVEKEFNAQHEEWQELQAWGRKVKVSITQQEVEEYAFAKAPIELISRYCGKDVYWTLRLFLKYVKELNHPKNKPLLNLYKFIEKPLIESVKTMETNGIRLDIGYLQSVIPLLEEEVGSLTQKIYDKAGKVFNVNSNLALKELFKSIGLKPELRRRKKLDGTREATPSYDGRTLEHNQNSFPIVKDIVEYRDRVKILGTYVRPLLAAGEFTHPSIKSEAARTGRMSMGIFNTLKRVDKDDTEVDPYTIRKAIIPLEDDCQLVSIDFCLAKGTEIETIYGPMPIEEVVYKKPGVLSVADGKKLEFKRVLKGALIGNRPVFKITFGDGSTVSCTDEHKWFTYGKEFKTTKELKVGDRLAHVMQDIDYWGYHRFYLWSNRNYYKKHRLVGNFVFGDLPKGYSTHHIDNNKANNHPSNLCYIKSGIHSKNHYILDKWWENLSEEEYELVRKKQQYGIHFKRRKYNGSDNPNSVLTEEQVFEIRRLYIKGKWGLISALAKRFNVKPVTIYKIATNQIWKVKNHTIKSIELIGMQDVYQIEVEDNHNYVLSNGLISKNSGIEYRLLAHFSNEPALVKLFSEDGDFHQYVADLLGVKRSVGKTFNFAKLYGASAASLSDKLKIPLGKVKALIAEYDVKFPSVSGFIAAVTGYCIQHGGIRNPFGRWRSIEKSSAYIAVNTLIQSTAADILKVAINRVSKFLIGKQSKLLFPVHDELVLNWHKNDGDIITPIVQRMEGFVVNDKPMFRVPITVSVGLCNGSWASKKEVTVKEMLQIFCVKSERRYDPNVPLLPWQKACTGGREVESLWVHKDTVF